jgi:hypothetical protein
MNRRRPSDRATTLCGLPRRVVLLVIAVLALAAPASAAADDPGKGSGPPAGLAAEPSGPGADKPADDATPPGTGSDPVQAPADTPAEPAPPVVDPPPPVEPPSIDPPSIDPPPVDPPVVDPPTLDPPPVDAPPIGPITPPDPLPQYDPPLVHPLPESPTGPDLGPTPEQHTEQPAPRIVETPTIPVDPSTDGTLVPPAVTPTVTTRTGLTASPSPSSLPAPPSLAPGIARTGIEGAGTPEQPAGQLIASLPGLLAPAHSGGVYSTGLSRLLGFAMSTPGDDAPVAVGLPNIAAAAAPTPAPVVSSHDEPVPAPARAPPADPSGPASAAAGGASGSGGSHAGGSVLALGVASSDLLAPSARAGRYAPRAAFRSSARPAHTRGRAPPVS